MERSKRGESQIYKKRGTLFIKIVEDDLFVCELI